MSGGAKAGIGLGGLIVVGLISLLLGKNPAEVLENVQTVEGVETTSSDGAEFSEEEQELATFSKKILASTEDVWTAYFSAHGLGDYRSPVMVLYTGSTTTSCGTGQSSMGPFYCSADEKLYIDLSFFEQMEAGQVGSGGDFAYAYVIAHEVGHHVQHLLGTLDQAHQKMARMSEADANRMSVRIELQADFLAGVWGYNENSMYSSLDDGDIEEAVKCASKIGDDYLEKQAYGYTVEESFTHGTAQQRIKWLKKGLTTGDISKGDTFSIAYDSL